MTGQRPISVNESWEAMMFKRIDHVEIVTDQLTRTAQFYTELLGFTVKARDRIERSGLGVPIDLVYLDLGGKKERHHEDSASSTRSDRQRTARPFDHAQSQR
jgi:catechol 2,3-dioxygenase-like lactoylglutathione lyase family enzyme